jgi:hypothetical protein
MELNVSPRPTDERDSQTPMEKALGEQQRLSSEVHNMLDLLEQKLRPILTQEEKPSVAVPEGGAVFGSSTILLAMTDIATQTKNAIRRIALLRDMIEV